MELTKNLLDQTNMDFENKKIYMSLQFIKNYISETKI